MRYSLPLGLLMIFFGVFGMVKTTFMDTTTRVSEPRRVVETEGYDALSPPSSAGSVRVHNIGLMDQRRHWLIVSGIVLLGGIMLLGIGVLSGERFSWEGAAERIRLAAEQGDTHAQMELGKMYAEGRAVVEPTNGREMGRDLCNREVGPDQVPPVGEAENGLATGPAAPTMALIGCCVASLSFIVCLAVFLQLKNRSATEGESLNGPGSSRTYRMVDDDASTGGHVSGGSSSPELDSDFEDAQRLQAKTIERWHSGRTDVSDLQPELERLEQRARSELNAMNRQPGQLGYSLKERKQGVYQVLVKQGYSQSEAAQTVEDMVQHGLLPDPPRK